MRERVSCSRAGLPEEGMRAARYMQIAVLTSAIVIRPSMKHAPTNERMYGELHALNDFSS